MLAQAESRAQQLTVLGTTGLEVVSYLSSGLPAAPVGKLRNWLCLDEAEKPQALVRFTVIKPLRDLVNAVPEAPNKQVAVCTKLKAGRLSQPACLRLLRSSYQFATR